MRCPSCLETFDFHDCITTPGKLPEEGSVGMCYECGAWWELKNGDTVLFEPTPDLLQQVIPQVSASHQRELAHWRE